MQMMASPLVLLLLGLMLVVVEAHNDASFHCDDEGKTPRVIRATYRPGIITLDGRSPDWDDIDDHGSAFSLRPALDPDEDHEFTGGGMRLKALHDGHSIFFLLQVPAQYQYLKGKQKNCPSVALMFKVGANATYRNMGGCKEDAESCSRETCGGHEVDIMHFSIGTAVPGKLYGKNILDNVNGTGADRFGHLVDLYSWTPHCRFLDGLSPNGKDGNVSGIAQNDWQGAWWHDSIEATPGIFENESPYSKAGKAGTYSFEFSRQLRTSDQLGQDVQFTIGETHEFSAAFWYPADGNPWVGSGHYTVSCDWINLEIVSAGRGAVSVSETTSVGALNVISLVLSIVAFAVSLTIGWWLKKGKSLPFTPIDNL